MVTLTPRLEAHTVRFGSAEWLAVCTPTLDSWCGRHAIPLHVWDDTPRGYPSIKFCVIDMLRAFLRGDSDWMIFVDADVWVTPDAPLPDMTALGIHSGGDDIWHAAHLKEWQAWCVLRFGSSPNNPYRNSGVWLCDRHSAAVMLTHAERPPYHVKFQEQHHWNWWLHLCEVDGVALHRLGSEWNKYGRCVEPAWFHHFWGNTKMTDIRRLQRHGIRSPNHDRADIIAAASPSSPPFLVGKEGEVVLSRNRNSMTPPNHIEEMLPAKWAAYVVNAPHYVLRLQRFYANLAKTYHGFLSDKIVTWPGLPKETPIPASFRPQNLPHQYLVTQDHIAILNQARVDALDWLFVFEDDAKLTKGFDEQLSLALAYIPDGWLAIQLGGHGNCNIKADSPEVPPYFIGPRGTLWSRNSRNVRPSDGAEAPTNLVRVKGCCGMHGTLWSRAGYMAAIDYYATRPNAIIDIAFAAWQRQCDDFYSTAKWSVVLDGAAATQKGRDS